MLKSAINISITRIVITIINLLLVLITTKHLGAEGRGVLSLFTLYITISTLGCGFIASPALSNYFNKVDFKKTFLISIIACVIGSIITSMFLFVLNYLTLANFIFILSMSIIQNLFLVNLYYLLAYNKIDDYNKIILLQIILQLTITYILFLNSKTIENYCIAFCIATGFSWLISLPKKINSNVTVSSYSSIIKQLTTLGLQTQLANTAQLISTRFNFFLINSIIGIAILGKYGITIMIIESLFILYKSLGTSLYTSINHNNKKDEQTQMLYNTIKISLLIFFLFYILVLIIPNIFWQLLFTQEFNTIKLWLILLIPYAFFNIYVISFSSYWGGKGNFKHNLKNSFIAAIAMILLSMFLIPKHGIIGAIIALNISIFIQALHAFYIYKKNMPNFKIINIIPTISNVIFLFNKLKK